MRFRGGGVGHISTRAATDFFKHDRDILDMESRRARQKEYAPNPSNVEDEDTAATGNDSEDMDTEDLEGGDTVTEVYEFQVVDDDELSESELVDYGYEVDGEDTEEEEDDSDAREEDDTTIDELGALSYAEY